MATNRISLKAPNGKSVIETTKDMEEYFLIVMTLLDQQHLPMFLLELHQQ